MSSYDDDDDYDDIDDGEVSHVPDRVRNLPQDHNKKKSKRAREAEANGGFIELTVAGVDLRVPVNDDFVANIREFPFLVERNGFLLGRMPPAYNVGFGKSLWNPAKSWN